jgi:hypothetical protein
MKAKKRTAVKVKKTKRKEIMEKILSKISDALKEYATPASERKMARKIKKAAISSRFVVGSDHL